MVVRSLVLTVIEVSEGSGLFMTVAADKSALAELAESFIAEWDLWLILGIVIGLIIAYKIFEKR